MRTSQAQPVEGRNDPAWRRLPRDAVRFARDASGTTAIEYALICALVFLAFAVGARNFGNGMSNMYNNVSTNMR